MRISFQTTETNQNVDRWKTTEKESSVQKIGTEKGYALDICGKAGDNEIYKGHGKTAEEIMQEAGMQNVAVTRDYMAVMSNSMSDEEFAKLQEDGYKPGEMQVEDVVTIVDQIKASMLQAGVAVHGYTDTLDMTTLTQITGNEGLAQDMAKAFSEMGVPLTEETARASMQALEEAETLTQPTDDTLKYMVANGKAPIIEDLYMAQYSSRMDGSRNGRGYYQDENGYLSRKADNADLDKLQSQIDKILKEAGLEGEEAKTAAKWLIGEGIPLTKETLNAYFDLKKINVSMERSKLLEAMATAVSDGRAPKQADLTGAGSLWEQATDIWNRVQNITDAAVDFTMQQGKSMTLQHLEEAQKQLEGNYQDINAKSITARRQLEEIRLQMTISANRELLKSGYAIETTELEQLVEALKNVEKQQNQMLFCGKDEKETQIRAELYTKTQTIVSEIPFMPIAVIGKYVGLYDKSGTVAPEATLEQVNAEGEALSAAYKKAGERYETFRTRPDSELGDSIRKAFRNVDALLEEVQMEITDANRRAVRILGYNHLDITKESILTVKAADQLLGNVVDKLTPAATLKMIRDGKNPLDMTLSQLDDYLSGEQQEAETEQEKYSKFLYKLEQKNEISEEEKESYIGIYRLLRQVEKTDGAVIGSLIHQGAELSFQNLLTAVRTYRSKPINTIVDDKLGTMQEMNQAGSKIDEQIASAFVRKIYHKLDGDNITEIAPDMDMQLETFAEHLQEAKVDEKAEKSYRRQQIEQFRGMHVVSEKQVEFLQTLDEPITLNNLMAADEFSQKLSKAFMKIRKEADKYNSNGENIFQKAAHELEEQFNSREEARAAYKVLTETEKQLLENAMYEDDQITSLDVKELGLLYKQVSFTAKLSDTEHYEIPLVTENSVTALHLQVIHSSEGKGTVEISMEQEQYGRMFIRLQVQDGKLGGLFLDFQKENKGALSELKGQIETALKQSGFGEDAEVKEIGDQTKVTSTAELYKAAKAVIGVMHRQAERG